MHLGTGLKTAYLALPGVWDGIPHLRGLAECISPLDQEFAHLHPARLVKHILAIKRRFGRSGFRLLYPGYDVPGGEGECHRDEVMRFAATAQADGILFHSLTYQELIARLDARYRAQHREHIEYLTARYL